MRRLLARFLCTLGLHAWGYSTLTDIDPERCEVQSCRRCPKLRGRQLERDPEEFGMRWGRWETFDPEPEPALGAWF